MKEERKYAPKELPVKAFVRKCGIYQIRNLINGKVYIGSSKRLDSRRRQHFSDLKCQRHGNSHLQRSYNKYGREAFVFEIIEFCQESERIEIEQYWVDHVERSQCYNLSLKVELPQQCCGSANFKSVKVVCLETGVFYETMSEAAIENSTNRNTIKDSCDGKGLAGGKHWMTYEDYIRSSKEDIEERLSYKSSYYRPVICLENKCIYNGIMDAAKQLNINKGNISNCCNKERHTVEGLHFLWLDEYENMSLEELKKYMTENNGVKPIVNLKTGTTYASIKECMVATGLSRKAIYYHCNNGTKNPRFAYAVPRYSYF